jgi:hypothetical protein
VEASISPINGKSVVNFIMDFHAWKRLIPIELIRCVHTHKGRIAIEKCDNPSHD